MKEKLYLSSTCTVHTFVIIIIHLQILAQNCLNSLYRYMLIIDKLIPNFHLLEEVVCIQPLLVQILFLQRFTTLLRSTRVWVKMMISWSSQCRPVSTSASPSSNPRCLRVLRTTKQRTTIITCWMTTTTPLLPVSCQSLSIVHYVCVSVYRLGMVKGMCSTVWLLVTNIDVRIHKLIFDHLQRV